MRNFVVVFLFFIFGTIFGKEIETASVGAGVVTESKNKTAKSDLDVVFSKLKNADKETLMVFNCEGIVFSYIDAAFSEEYKKEYKDVWFDFYEKRSDFDREKNEKIDRALFFAPKRFMAVKYQQDFKDLVARGTNVVFVYQIDENKMKFPDKIMIKSVISSMLKDIGVNLSENSSVKLLVTNSKKVSSDLADIVREFAKSESEFKSSLNEHANSNEHVNPNKHMNSNEYTNPNKYANSSERANLNEPANSKTAEQSKHKLNSIKRIILVHDGSLKLDDKQINLPIKEMSVNFRNIKSDLTKDQVKKQIEILGKVGEWMHDMRIREITNCANDEDLIYLICKQSIMDVCSCSEIIEERIYEKIASVVSDNASLEHLEEIIDNFQEIHNTLPSIFHYVIRAYLWEMCHKLGLDERKAIEMLKEMKKLYFNEHEVREAPYKIARRLGCGIHWRDMAKYEFVRNFLMTGEKVTKSANSQRVKIYMRVLNTVFDKVNSNMDNVINEKKNEFIRILHENKVEDKKIMDVFKISEEKFKNILNTTILKNEESNEKNRKK